MRCPKCDAEIELAWQAVRRARRALGQCAICGAVSKKYRCEDCRRKQADERHKREHAERALHAFISADLS